LTEIKKLRDTYGQQHARDSQAIPYRRVAAFLQEVEALVKEKHENDASKRVEKVAARIEAAVERIEKKKTPPITYAQAARGGNAGQAQGVLQGAAEPLEGT